MALGRLSTPTKGVAKRRRDVLKVEDKSEHALFKASTPKENPSDKGVKDATRRGASREVPKSSTYLEEDNAQGGDAYPHHILGLTI